MPRYELIVLMPGSVSEEEVPAQVSSIREVLKKHDATVVEESTLGRRKLAYRIRGAGSIWHHHGTYHVYQFDSEPAKLLALATELKLHPAILRQLITGVKVQTPAQIEARKELQEKIRTRRATAQVQAAQKEAQAEAEVGVDKEAVEKREAAKEEKKIALEELDEKLEELLGKELTK